MDMAVGEVAGDLGDEHVYLGLTPTEGSRVQRETETLEAFHDVDLVPAAELLHEGVLGPGIGGPHEHALLDVDEAGLAHPRLVHLTNVRAHGAAQLARRLAEQLAPAHQVRAVGSTVV